MRVALYARVSTKDKGQDTENQLLQLRHFCQQQGWAVVQEYVDQKTGRTSDREAFQLLFQHAYEKRYDLCLFWALDRFSREGATDTLRKGSVGSGDGASGPRKGNQRALCRDRTPDHAVGLAQKKMWP